MYFFCLLADGPITGCRLVSGAGGGLISRAKGEGLVSGAGGERLISGGLWCLRV